MNASQHNSQTVSSTEKQQTPNQCAPSEPSDQTELLALAEHVAHFGSWEWDITKPRAIWSKEMFCIFGLDPQAEGLTLEEFRSFLHPDDIEEVTQKMQNAFKMAKLNKKGELDYRIIRHDGSVRIIHSQRQVKELTQDGRLKVIVGVDQDVTEQRYTAQVSAESTKLLALAEVVAHFGSWQLDITQPYATWSPGMFRIFGVEPAQKGFTWEEYLSFIHPQDREAAAKNAQTMLTSHLNHHESFDYRIIRGDGAVRILHAQRQVREVDASGKPKVVVGVDQDVTEQRQAEEDLKRSEERFRIVAEAANVMVYEIEVPSRKIHFIKGAQQLIGYEPQEVGPTLDWVTQRIHPDDLPHVTAAWNQVVNNPNNDKYAVEYRFQHKNGNYIIVKDTAKAIKDQNGKTVSFIGGVRDVTQRRRDKEEIEQYSKHLEELVNERTKQLIAYERLAAIGQVAGMVGHDIRNPLQALTSEVYLLRTDLATMPQNDVCKDMEESLGSIEHNIGYINKIVADLQDYSRQLKPEYTQVDFKDLITHIFETISVPSKIQLVFNIKTLSIIKCDPTFIRRALTNLVNNAIQAMPNGGKLEITAYPQENNAFITVADSGMGMSEEVKTKIFTPMFTTKTKGQGLGLAVVKRLVEAQGGIVCFESEMGKGTKFIIKLPINQAAQSA
jgi:PAS domain S-box-containing protein